MIDVYGTLSDNGAPEGYLLADGAMTGGLANDLGDAQAPPPGNAQAEWDSTTASNGSHTLQAVGYDAAWAFVSPALSVTASNAFSAWTGNDVLIQSDGDPAWAQMTAPSGTVSWTVQIADPAGSLVRSWSGVGSAVQFSWDGTNSAGAPVTLEGQYATSVTAFDGSGNRTSLAWGTHVLYDPPQGLALFVYPSLGQVAATKMMAHYVAAVFEQMRSPANGFEGLVLTEDQRCPRWKISPWMARTVTDFYISSDGLELENVAGAAVATRWRDIGLWPFGPRRAVELYHPGVN